MKWYLLIVLILMVSCQSNRVIPNTCGVKDPLRDLAWLKKLDHNDGLGSSIIQGTFQGETVYAVYQCGRCFAGSSIALYRCDGSTICSGLALDVSANGCGKIAENLTDKRILVEYAP